MLILKMGIELSQVTAEQEFELYSKVCDVLFKQKRFDIPNQSVNFLFSSTLN